MIWLENELVTERENERLANEATMIQHAAASVLSPKEGGGAFRKLIETLIGKR